MERSELFSGRRERGSATAGKADWRPAESFHFEEIYSVKQ